MTPGELRELFHNKGVRHTERSVQNGIQFRCEGGEVFTVYETGRCSLQGKETDLTRAVAKCAAGAAKSGIVTLTPTPKQAPVFIVYGHDIAARNELELLLHRMDLEPIILGNLPAEGDTVIEKLERYIGQHGKVGFACVLLTPDDEGCAMVQPDKKRPRARQNVVLELGMVLASLGRRHVAILRQESVEDPSDIGGLIWIGFKNSVAEVGPKLFKELSRAGYNPRADGL